MPSYTLTDDELLLLDGKCSATIQDEIEKVKQKKTLHDDPIIGAAILESLKSGTFEYRVIHDMRYCSLCKKSGGYATYTRNSRHHRKGDKNYDKPLGFTGIRLNPGFVTVQGHGSFCQVCDRDNNYTGRILKHILDNNLPIELIGNTQTKFKKDKMRICYECKAEIFESEMAPGHALMGGYYPCGCSKCGAKQLLFGHSHTCTDKFRMLPVENPNV